MFLAVNQIHNSRDDNIVFIYNPVDILRSMKRILIIDNSSQAMMTVASKVKEAGHFVKVIEKEDIGLEYYAENQIDVVIMGVLPPDLEGLKTIIRFKSRYPSVNIFAIENGSPSLQYEAYHPLKSARVFGARQTFTSPKEISQLLIEIEKLPEQYPRHQRRKRRQLVFFPNPSLN